MNQKGFSLIELMIVVVIIGILGSIAVPTYKDYVVRAKVTELFAMAQPAKLAVTEALMSGILPATINNDSLGLKKEKTGKIKEMKIDEAIITIMGNSEALNIPEDKIFTIALTPTVEEEGITWKCTVDADDLKKYAPAGCR